MSDSLIEDSFAEENELNRAFIEDPAENTRASKTDLYVWGCLGLLTVADVVRNVCTQTSEHSGDVSSLLGDVGQLEVVVAGALGIYQTMKATNSAWTTWALALTAAAGVAAVCESLGDFGFGSADRGTGFSAGAIGLTTVVSELDGADPDPSLWSGTAAENYKARNQENKELLKRIAALDQQMVTIVQRQAEQAEQVRQGMAGTKTVLSTGAAVCAVVAACAAADPTGAANVALGKLVMGFGGAVLVTCLVLAGIGISEGVSNGNDAETVSHGYHGVAADAASMGAAGASAFFSSGFAAGAGGGSAGARSIFTPGTAVWSAFTPASVTLVSAT